MAKLSRTTGDPRSCPTHKRRNRRLRRRVLVAALLAAVCWALFAVALRQPRHDRDWEFGFEELPSVTIVGEQVSIRPSYDTLDPDDIGKSDCANPGIVKADYGIEDGTSPSAERGESCDTLAVPYTFAQVGEFEISMTVTSNEDEKAVASMILTVVDANAPETDDGGFTITADPMVAGIGQIVTFIGDCKTTKKVEWCESGEVKTMSCGSGKHCGWNNQGGYYDCVR